ncbi:MAG: O-antigen ligase family protein [Anaerolineae bacterium]|nr:O-antigen ligase family protein [Anaerolineae bacterium]
MIHAQRALVAVGFVIALVVLQEQFMGYSWFPTVGSTYYGKHLRRVTGLLGNPAFHAVTIAMTLPFAWRAMLENRRLPLRRLMLLVLGVMYTGLFLTYNRTGWLGGVLGILVFLLFYPRFRRPFLKLSPLLALLISLNWWRIASSYAFTERLVAVNPITYRVEAYRLSWQTFLKHMALGVGFGNLAQYIGIEAPHNSFLWMLVTAGLSGFIPYLGTFIMMGLDSLLMYLKAPRWPGMRRDLLVAFWVALLSYTAQCFAVDMLYGIYPNIIFFFIAGAVLGYHEAVYEAQRAHAPSPMPRAAGGA